MRRYLTSLKLRSGELNPHAFQLSSPFAFLIEGQRHAGLIPEPQGACKRAKLQNEWGSPRLRAAAARMRAVPRRSGWASAAPPAIVLARAISHPVLIKTVPSRGAVSGPPGHGG